MINEALTQCQQRVLQLFLFIMKEMQCVKKV